MICVIGGSYCECVDQIGESIMTSTDVRKCGTSVDVTLSLYFPLTP
jgi:hypothetical protein